MLAQRNSRNFQEFYEYYERVTSIIAQCAKGDTKKINKIKEASKLDLLEEDITCTISSFSALDSLNNLKKQTIELSERLYLARLHAVCVTLLAAMQQNQIKAARNKGAIKELLTVMALIRTELPDSLRHKEGFHNPYPRHILFSQQFHAPKFSEKAGRVGVSGRAISNVAEEIKAGTISADRIRVNVYLAHFAGETRVFANNNRTLVTLSRAETPASRIVPELPTQELMERIERLKANQHDPNRIRQEKHEGYDEDREEGKETLSQKPAQLNKLLENNKPIKPKSNSGSSSARFYASAGSSPQEASISPPSSPAIPTKHSQRPVRR